ncbi:MAG: polyprenyl synthetase family protein [Pseudomonadota bacterium]
MSSPSVSDQFAPLQEALGACARTVNGRLEELLADRALDGETLRPPRLMAAMRHGVLNGGKRLRPFLLMQSLALFDDGQNGLDAACALECLHSYSLVHDDLPAMDDDDLRRGQPTVHKAYDEALAILAGDGLLTLAFDIMARESTCADAVTRGGLVLRLARAAGLGGMVGGQVLDIEAETTRPSEVEIRRLQAMKTGALLRFACEAGAMLGGAKVEERQALTRYGEIVGLAFQLADDVLDVTADAATMGKATGKDAEQGKGTLVDLHGVEAVRGMLDDLVAEAEAVLAPFGERSAMLVATARYIAQRSN